ncbi:MAG: copper chaperone PCu(A)C [Acidimicrobiia bacterium]|nr:copper chaperone PCu(A)C [Acidimicrobiia bacterium]
MRKRSWMVLSAVTALVLVACGGDDDSESDAADTGGTTATTAEAGVGATVSVSGVWARSSPSMADAGAAYMVIENLGGTDDALIAASVDPSVAGSVELHEVVMVDGESGDTGHDMGDDTEGGMSSTTMGGDMRDGTMRMQEVDQIDLPAGESVELRPGGYHLMLLDLVSPLEEGATVAITLEFENATSVTVNAEVRTE